jgi:hypothetical protein
MASRANQCVASGTRKQLFHIARKKKDLHLHLHLHQQPNLER